MIEKNQMTRNMKRVESGRAAIGAMFAAGFLILSAAAAAQNDTRHAYVSDAITDRTPLVTTFPKYPYVARRDRIEGETVVCFSISSDGKVVRPSVRRSTHRIFNRPAIKAMKQSTFMPLAPGEAKSLVKTCRTFRFKLDPILAENSGN